MCMIMGFKVSYGRRADPDPSSPNGVVAEGETDCFNN